MKSARDPRHKNRIVAVKELFAESFSTQPHISELARNVSKNLAAIDEIIQKSAPAWPLDKLNKIDLAVLRLAVYELLYSKEPPKAVIDEAVEIAKEFGTETSASFINGVLGTVFAGEKKVTKNKE